MAKKRSQKKAKPKLDRYMVLVIVLVGLLALYQVWGEEINTAITGQQVRAPGVGVGTPGISAGAQAGFQVGAQMAAQQRPVQRSAPGADALRLKQRNELCNTPSECAKDLTCRRNRAGSTKKCRSLARNDRYCEHDGDCREGVCLAKGWKDPYCGGRGDVHDTLFETNLKFGLNQDGPGKDKSKMFQYIRYNIEPKANKDQVTFVISTTGMAPKNTLGVDGNSAYIIGLDEQNNPVWWHSLSGLIKDENSPSILRLAVNKEHFNPVGGNALVVVTARKKRETGQRNADGTKRYGTDYDAFDILEWTVEDGTIKRPGVRVSHSQMGIRQFDHYKTMLDGPLKGSINQGAFASLDENAAALAAVAALASRVGNAGAGVAAMAQAMRQDQDKRRQELEAAQRADAAARAAAEVAARGAAGGKKEKQACKQTSECSQDPAKLVCRRSYYKSKKTKRYYWGRSKKTTCRKPVGNRGPCINALGNELCRTGLVCRRGYRSGKWVRSKRYTCRAPVKTNGPCERDNQCGSNVCKNKKCVKLAEVPPPPQQVVQPDPRKFREDVAPVNEPPTPQQPEVAHPAIPIQADVPDPRAALALLDSCSDSDNGVTIHQKGTVTKGDLVIPDACDGSDLIEAACKDGDTVDVRIPCEHGCYDGVCRREAAQEVIVDVERPDPEEFRDRLERLDDHVVDPTPTPTPTPEPAPQGCVDSDNTNVNIRGGPDTFVVGTTTGVYQGSRQTLTDRCITARQLTEYVCNAGDNHIFSQPENCANGCANGVCLEAAPEPEPAPEQQVSPADTSNDGTVDDMELLMFIDKWSNNQVDDMELLMAIELWSKQ